MRATMSESGNSVPSESFLGVLDQFAALRSYSSALPAVGGYRLLAPRGHVARRPRAIAAPITAALAHARLRLTGFLSVMFVGALGLAVLAGPANCPACGSLDTAEQTSLARMGYAENAQFTISREQITRAAEVHAAAAVSVSEPLESAVGISPITTSSLEPAREAVTAKHDDLGTVLTGSLPTELDSVGDAGPPVRLAATTLSESDLTSTLPAVTVTTPPAPVASTDAKTLTAMKPHAQPRKRITRAYRTPVARAAKQHTPDNPMLTQRAPRWAQQMYVSPWQSQAFSYTR